LGNKAEECRENSSAAFTGSQENKKEDKLVKKRISLIPLALLLAMSLVITGCPPPPPNDVVVPPPVEPLRWYPSTWLPAGVTWDDLVYIADYITEASGGRIIVEPTAPGAIVPVLEQLAAVAAGVTPAMLIYPGYFSGILPIMEPIATGGSLLLEPWDVYQFFERQRGGRMRELVEQELARFGDVVLVEPIYRIFDVIMVSRVPVRGIEDLDGLKLRSGDVPIKKTMAALGAAVTWFPGGEIYAKLAAGVVDAVTFAHVSDSIAMGFHEVSTYWVKQPFFPSGTELFIVNGAVWRALPDDLQAIVRSAVKAANIRGLLASKVLIEAGWAKAKELGVEVIEWSHEDYLEWMTVAAGMLDDYAVDPASTEAIEILKEFLIEWEPELARAVGLL